MGQLKNGHIDPLYYLCFTSLSTYRRGTKRKNKKMRKVNLKKSNLQVKIGVKPEGLKIYKRGPADKEAKEIVRVFCRPADDLI